MLKMKLVYAAVCFAFVLATSESKKDDFRWHWGDPRDPLWLTKLNLAIERYKHEPHGPQFAIEPVDHIISVRYLKKTLPGIVRYNIEYQTTNYVQCYVSFNIEEKVGTGATMKDVHIYDFSCIPIN